MAISNHERLGKALELLNSGLISGTILVWETDREMPSRDLAIEQETSPFKSHKLILDWQQRLTSLSAILRGTPVRGRKRSIDILFNIDHSDSPPGEVPEVEDDTEGDDDDDETDADETASDEGVGGSVPQGDDDDDEILDVLIIEDII